MTGFGFNILGFGSSAGPPAVEIPTDTLINNLQNRSQISASTYIGNGGTLIIPANFWLWSTNTTYSTLTVDVDGATIENNGNIVGRGGAAGGSPGGNAINITGSGVTIINASGAYIAGGGGGGRTGNPNGPGGGGAGGGSASASSPDLGNPSPNAPDGNWSGYYYSGGRGGGAGGGAGSTALSPGSGAKGGWVLPGSGSSNAPGYGGYPYGGAGGSAGNQGTQGGASGGRYGAGGGGGWGANGGSNGQGTTGGTGGKAIEDNGNTYTLSNSGTIYGATT